MFHHTLQLLITITIRILYLQGAVIKSPPEYTTNIQKLRQNEYNFKQNGTIRLKRVTTAADTFLDGLELNSSFVLYFESFGEMQFPSRFDLASSNYECQSSGLIFMKSKPAERFISYTFNSTGFINFFENKNVFYIIEKLLQVCNYQFTSSGKITLTKVSIQEGDYANYHFMSEGIIFLVENSKVSLTSSVISLPITEAEYLKRMEKYIKEKYWKEKHPELIQLKQTLSAIYENFEDLEHLCIFTANAIFTTGGFKHLKQIDATPEDKWCSRGIIMVTSEENYLQMAKVSFNSEVYDNPDSVASLSNISVESSLKFYNYLIKKAQETDLAFKITWENVLKVLNISGNQSDNDCGIDIKNRFNEYLGVKESILE